MQLAHCTVTKYGDRVKLINEHTATVPDCSDDGNLCNSLENRSKQVSLMNNFELGSIEANDRPYIAELLKSVSMMTDVVESLVKRVIIAETEVANEKGKVNLGLTELKRKTLQIERMSAKVKEMENFAACTNDRLNEMKQKVEHMVQETSRQKQHAAENERELAHVKQDFETLKSYVNHLIQSREEVTSSDGQFQEREVLDRLLEKNSRLENERVLKESEVQKLMEDNVIGEEFSP
ncbi:hypothetical protein HPP92_007128 [Vanilla planifolia]|uniref:Uncharacterized protein n=1 Tax=Vanilla planifolia TaxID=51239 RepID=A0A835V7I2_VANPL|nr:hypothetical protein HPP92_007128 [Vanilla planifolia]